MNDESIVKDEKYWEDYFFGKDNAEKVAFINFITEDEDKLNAKYWALKISLHFKIKESTIYTRLSNYKNFIKSVEYKYFKPILEYLENFDNLEIENEEKTYVNKLKEKLNNEIIPVDITNPSKGRTELIKMDFSQLKPEWYKYYEILESTNYDKTNILSDAFIKANSKPLKDIIYDTYSVLFPKTSKKDTAIKKFTSGILKINTTNKTAELKLFAKRKKETIEKIYQGNIIRINSGGYDNVHIILSRVSYKTNQIESSMEGTTDLSYIQFALLERIEKNDFVIALAVTTSCGEKKVRVQTSHRILLRKAEEGDAEDFFDSIDEKTVDKIIPLLHMGEERFLIEEKVFEKIMGNFNYNENLKFKKSIVYNITKGDIERCLDCIPNRKKPVEFDKNSELNKLIQLFRRNNNLGTIQFDRIEEYTQDDIKAIVEPLIKEQLDKP